MYESIDEIKAATAKSAHGQHWFAPDTMRFFRSRVSPKVYPTTEGAFFVTSEQREDDTPRRYTVRYADGDGHVHTVGPFNQMSRTLAHSAASALAVLANSDHGGRGLDAATASPFADAA